MHAHVCMYTHDICVCVQLQRNGWLVSAEAQRASGSGKALFILTYMPLALLGDHPELIFETDAVYGHS